MANVRLLFCGTEETNTQNMNVQCFYNVENELSIKIEDYESKTFKVISIDRETAILFSKELRKQIALID